MRLRKLTLSGFKSFADTTEFTFDDAVTGIVGPNGCGKSNVVDAIKWVLGERSSKSLRGQEMIDVIFAGSASRKPLGMASVKLTFDNPIINSAVPAPIVQPTPAEPAPEAEATASAADAPDDALNAPAATLLTVPTAPRQRNGRALPVDADTVEIERRLYRDGESEYLINAKLARLKDIREMFLDTGVGADAYSIIEQGKVDAMLLASPQERRVIFEEAAGIAKYKQRRIEATRKLDRTQTNLTSVREQLDSTERRLRLVRGQAAKARRFVELDTELKAWRVSLAFEQYDDLEQRLGGLTSRQTLLDEERTQSGRTLAELEHTKQERELARADLSGQAQQLEQARLSATHEEQQASQRKAMLERSAEEAQRQSAADRQRLGELEGRRRTTEAAIEEHRSNLTAMVEQMSEAEKRLAAAQAQRSEVMELLNDRRTTAAQKVSAAQRIERERIQLLANISGEARRAESLREQNDRLSQKVAKHDDDARSLRDAILAGEQSAKAAHDSATGLETLLAELEGQVGRLSADRRVRAERVGQLEQELARLDSRRAVLHEMVETRAGFGEAVRQVLSLRDKGERFAGVIAPLADLIETRPEVDADAAGAVEMALGPDLQGLVVESVAALPARDDIASLPGRVTFLPMSGVSGGAGLPTRDVGAAMAGMDGLNLADASSRVVSLRSLVKPRDGDHADPRLMDLLDRLLGRTFLVSNLDAAMLLSAGPLAGIRARFITRDGALLDADGRISAGPAGSGEESLGLLRRRAELESLTAQVAGLTTQLQLERDALGGIDAEAATLAARTGDTRTALSQHQRAALGEQNKLDRLHADAARIDRERRGVEQELSQLRERLAKLESDQSGMQERADSLGRLHEEESAAAATLEHEVRTIQSTADSALEHMSGAKIEVGRLNEQLGGARRELARLELARDEFVRQIRDLTAQLQRLEDRVREHSAGIEQAAALAADAGVRAATLSGELAEARALLAEAEKHCAELAEFVHAARQRFSVVERDWHSLEVSKREVEVKRENLEQRMLEEIGIDLTANYPEYREMMAPGDVARIDTSEAARSIDILRDAIRKLGSVNMDALSEETSLEAQNEDLVKQVADIDAARTQLIQLIEELNAVSKARFGEVFDKIRVNFGGDRGMFRKLFGGGRAEVRLMPLIREVEQPDGTVLKVETDQTDLLESGIEVVAKPPGKEPRSISQLSGGEKTLTAVALLMSIFRSKPSCFCVLDEVDAALDEGNVARFGQAVRDFTDLSHFIVITHNKRTMQTADRLYGVTMQERGVSTRVSVRFDEVAKNGEIHHAKDKPHAIHPEPPIVEVKEASVLDAIVARRSRRSVTA